MIPNIACNCVSVKTTSPIASETTPIPPKTKRIISKAIPSNALDRTFPLLLAMISMSPRINESKCVKPSAADQQSTLSYFDYYAPFCTIAGVSAAVLSDIDFFCFSISAFEDVFRHCEIDQEIAIVRIAVIVGNIA